MSATSRAKKPFVILKTASGGRAKQLMEWNCIFIMKTQPIRKSNGRTVTATPSLRLFLIIPTHPDLTLFVINGERHADVISIFCLLWARFRQMAASCLNFIAVQLREVSARLDRVSRWGISLKVSCVASGWLQIESHSWNFKGGTVSWEG